MAQVEEVLKLIKDIEHKFRHHGMWGNPYIPPPHIQIRDEWQKEVQLAAECLNRVFFIRSLPDCSRLFGPVRESMIQAFLIDYRTPGERVNFARNQVNLLLSDLALVRGLDITGLSRVDE